jgi:thiol-disulfide isomerase/thioredoxin
MKKLIYAAALFFAVSSCTTSKTENYATIKGQIKSGNVDQVDIEWLKENPINNKGSHYTALVDSQSNFSFIIPLKSLAAGRIKAGAYFHDISLLPGDQIDIEIDGDNSIYKGKGSAKNNFLYELEKNGLNAMVVSRQSFEKDFTFNEYLSYIKDIENKRIELIDSFNLNNELSNEFIEYFRIETDVFCEGQLQNYPRLYSYKNKVDPDTIQLPVEYIQSYQFNHVVDDEKIASSSYLYNVQTAINKKVSALAKQNPSLDYADLKFQILVDSLNGKTKEYALAQLICSRLSYSDNYDSVAIELFNKIEHDNISGDEVQLAIANFNKKHNLIGEHLSEEFAITVLVDTANVKILFSDMMKKYKGNVVYVDMWSLGCGPCCIAMPNSKKLKEKLADQPVRFVYITVDGYTDELSQNLFEVSLTKENHYIFKNGFNSKIHEFMGINWVPNYMIFDKEGKLVSYNADRPTAEDENGISPLETQLRTLAIK